MRKFYFSLLAFFTFSYVMAGGGIAATYMSFRLNGGPQFYHGTGPYGYPTLDGAVLASNLDLYSDRLDMQLRGLTTWYNSGCFITSASIHYRVYKNTDPAPSFITLNLINQIGIGFNNVDWSDDSPLIHLLAGLTSAGTYNFEVYFSVTTNNIGGCASVIYENNGGSNFIGTFTVSTPLSVKFEDISVKRKDNNNELSWTTASETNNDYFEIQHSKDGQIFETIGKVKGNGNSTETQNYTYLHSNVSAKDSYYRLKQVDYDGRYEYSSIVSVGLDTENLKPLAIAPNPVTDMLNVFGLDDDATYKITDFAGRQYLSGFIAPGQTLEVSSLNSGFYLVTIQNGTSVSSFKMIKQ